MKKEKLMKEIKFDLFCDKAVSIISSMLLVLSFSFDLIWRIAAGLNLMIWFNSYLITKRNIQILEGENE